ncbi:hypothetical protein H8356DRAFT_1431589 [Neocallimastix lanati (nom. inval.)]|nr:hypothetical protein H8356DRAFT_1431589 [Neocallimastix sp. JGI-2020a]
MVRQMKIVHQSNNIYCHKQKYLKCYHQKTSKFFEISIILSLDRRLVLSLTILLGRHLPYVPSYTKSCEFFPIFENRRPFYLYGVALPEGLVFSTGSRKEGPHLFLNLTPHCARKVRSVETADKCHHSKSEYIKENMEEVRKTTSKNSKSIAAIYYTLFEKDIFEKRIIMKTILYSKLETIRDILKSKIKTTHRSVHFIEDDDGIPKIKISTSKEVTLSV